MSAAICTLDLASMWDREVDYQRLHGAAPETFVATKRVWYAGALAALDLQRGGATREQLMAEIVSFGRQIGSTVETAR